MDLYFYTPEQRRMVNGKIVTIALQVLGGESTTENLLQQISYSIDQPEELIEPELKQVLRRGIRNGFLIKRARKYLFPVQEYSYQVDSDQKRKRSRSRSRSSSRTPPPRPSTSYGNRVIRTPFRRNRTGASSSAARLEAINRREREEDERENERARTSYRQPKGSPKRKRIKFAMSPEAARQSFPRRPSQNKEGSPESSPTKLRKLNLDDEEDDDDL